jgi:hypothetical protein
MVATTTAATGPRKIGPDLHGTEKVRYLLRRALASEAASWHSIGRFIARRPRVPAGASGHGYDAPIRAVLVTFLVVSIAEIAVIDLLARPWPVVRLPLLVVGIWGALAMTGMLLGNCTRPHAVGSAGIRVRHGGGIDIDLPWDAITSVTRRRRLLSGAPALSLTGEGDDQTLNQVVQGGTDIDIELERPRRIRLPQGEITASRIRIAVDDPDAFLEAVRTHFR